MTILLPYSRTLSKQLPIRPALLTRLISTNSILRVAHPKHGGNPSSSPQNESRDLSQSQRNYATATKSAGRPKAHTGREGPQKSAVVKKATKTTTSKPKAKPKKKVSKAKAKPKPKARRPVKRPLTELGLKRKAAQDRTALKKKGLLHQEPKQLPQVAWTVYNATAVKQVTGAADIGSMARANAAAYKSITPEEREALNHTANENKVKNEQAYKRWVQSFTPLQIKDANLARQTLLREAKANKVKHLAPFRQIKDDRTVKRPATPNNYFLQERWASGDYKGMTSKEAFGLVHREYQGLSAAEKKRYEDQAAADRDRYLAEYKSVYGIDPGKSRGTTA